jgi:hypothetical protein
MYITVHVECPLFLWDFSETWIFSIDLRKIIKYRILSKFVQWEPSCFMRTDGQTDRQTDMTKLVVTLRSFANAPKNDTFMGKFNWNMQYLGRCRVKLTFLQPNPSAYYFNVHVYKLPWGFSKAKCYVQPLFPWYMCYVPLFLSFFI